MIIAYSEKFQLAQSFNTGLMELSKVSLISVASKLIFKQIPSKFDYTGRCFWYPELSVSES